jgi:hypothetical protein
VDMCVVLHHDDNVALDLDSGVSCVVDHAVNHGCSGDINFDESTPGRLPYSSIPSSSASNLLSPGHPGRATRTRPRIPNWSLGSLSPSFFTVFGFLSQSSSGILSDSYTHHHSSRTLGLSLTSFLHTNTIYFPYSLLFFSCNNSLFLLSTSPFSFLSISEFSFSTSVQRPSIMIASCVIHSGRSIYRLSTVNCQHANRVISPHLSPPPVLYEISSLFIFIFLMPFKFSLLFPFLQPLYGPYIIIPVHFNLSSLSITIFSSSINFFHLISSHLNVESSTTLTVSLHPLTYQLFSTLPAPTDPNLPFSHPFLFNSHSHTFVSPPLLFFCSLLFLDFFLFRHHHCLLCKDFLHPLFSLCQQILQPSLIETNSDISISRLPSKYFPTTTNRIYILHPRLPQAPFHPDVSPTIRLALPFRFPDSTLSCSRFLVLFHLLYFTPSSFFHVFLGVLALSLSFLLYFYLFIYFSFPHRIHLLPLRQIYFSPQDP